MEQDIREHFFSHGQQDIEITKRSCHLCQLRTFPNYTTAPVTIVNQHDTAVIPPTFRFISRVTYGTGVSLAESVFRSGCDCSEDGTCQTNACSCVADALSDDESEDEVPAKATGRKTGEKLATAYITDGPRRGLLKETMLKSLAPIFECHDACSCSKECANRVVDRGRKVPLKIFRTKDGRGWGVRSVVDIRAGQFVDTYIGEVITSATADTRRAAAIARQSKDVYLFELDKFYDPNSIDERLSQPPLLVDGEFESGPTRFVNHSCEPNLKIFVRVGDHADKHVQDLALFAIKDVPAGTELTFDYLNGRVEEEEDEEDPEKLKELTRCLCGSDNCRGFLW